MAMMMIRVMIRIMAMMMTTTSFTVRMTMMMFKNGILSGLHVSGSTICSPHNQVPKLAAGLQDFHSEKCRQFSLSPKPRDFAKSKGQRIFTWPQSSDLGHLHRQCRWFSFVPKPQWWDKVKNTYMYTCIVQHIFKAFCQSSMNLDQEGLLIEPIEGQQQNWNVKSEKVFQEIKR